MKFSNGNWLMQEGVTPHYATEVDTYTFDGKVLTISVPCREIRHRGDTLQGPLLTVRISSPAPSVLRIQASHFEGATRTPLKFIDPEPTTAVQFDDEEASLFFNSGELTVRIDRKSWKMVFEGAEEYLTESVNRGLAYMQTTFGNFMQEHLGLGVGEYVYGMGERFTSLIKNGQSIDIWNEDGGTNSNQAYKNIPFYLTNRGYGVLVNDPGKVSFEVASERTSGNIFSVPGEVIDYFLIFGGTPEKVLERYTNLTGKPALPPLWSFGLWLSTSFTTNYDEETVNKFVDGMASRDIPLSVFHYDCFWMKAFHWSDFTFDSDVFPDPRGMLDRLHSKGLKVSAWINPYIAQASSLFLEGKENGYFLKRPNGDVWQWDLWQPGMAIVDFTNPAACAWYQEKLKVILDLGVDALKTDFGERIPTDCVYYDGSDPLKMHNYYTQIYNKTVYSLLTRERGQGEAVLFARSATVGGQLYPVHWGGDCWSTFEAMAESLRGGLSLCLSGFGFWSHDIGGFEGNPSPDVFKRWIAFGLLSSHSRLHGSASYRVPWLVDEESVDVLRHFTKLKLKLIPYLWSAAVDAHLQGIPMMRSMHLAFPDDPACETLERQYMLGPSLLVAPIMSKDDEVAFYVPEGIWTDFLSHEKFEGPRWFKRGYDFFHIPILVRPNAAIATSNAPDPLKDPLANLEVQHFEAGAEEPTAFLYDSTGKQCFELNIGNHGMIDHPKLGNVRLVRH